MFSQERAEPWTNLKPNTSWLMCILTSLPPSFWVLSMPHLQCTWEIGKSFVLLFLVWVTKHRRTQKLSHNLFGKYFRNLALPTVEDAQKKTKKENSGKKKNSDEEVISGVVFIRYNWYSKSRDFQGHLGHSCNCGLGSYPQEKALSFSDWWYVASCILLILWMKTNRRDCCLLV